MKWPFGKKIEKKTGSPLVQYQGGIYYIGASGSSTPRLKDYVAGYRLCDTVYSCVNLIVQSAVLVPWYVYRDNADGEPDEIDKHPLVEWMKKPGLGMDWTEFLTRNLSFYLITGNSYIRKMIGSFGLRGQMEVLFPQFMTPKPKPDGTLSYYEYQAGGRVVTFPIDQIVHTKTFNPENALIGLSPIQVLARKIDMAQFGELWTIALLEKQCQPSMILMNKSLIGGDQLEKLKQDLHDQYSGYENAGNPMLLTGGEWSVDKGSFSPKEVEFLNSKRALMREICAAYKVAPELFGDSENKTYSNIKEARKALYQEAVLPLLGKFKNAFNEQIVPAFDASGVYLDYDVSSIDALSEDLNSLWTRLLDAYRAGTVTRNELRTEIGWGEIEGAPDVIAEPVSMITTPVDQLGKEPEPAPVELPPAKPAEEPPVEEPPKKPPKARIVSIKGGFWQLPERKEAKWNAFARRVQARERGIQKIAAQHLREQAERIVKQVKKAPSVNTIDRWLVLDKEKEAGLFVDSSIRWYIDSFTKAVRSGMAAGKGEISDGEEKVWVFKPEYEAKLRKIVVESGTKIAETTMEDIIGLLETAELENQTVTELAKAIQVLMGERETWRSRRIAMTEAAKVENAGELIGYKESEFIELKGWLCAFVEHSRQDHMDADAKYSDDPIELDSDFEVGDKLMAHPGDPKGGASQVCNCLCTLYPQVKEL